jgi:hypothetical protein
MRRKTIAIASALCWLGVAAPQMAHAQYGRDDGYYDDGYYDDDAGFDIDVNIDLVGFFRPGLSAYGRWASYGSYGEVWCPTGLGSGWRPYRDGHWVLTDAGWAWVSDEPWGWGPYHYGRWFHASNGWCWVPGREWAPSWVSWRHGGGVVGWAPLPPWAGWQTSGVREVWIEPRYYNFVEERHFVEPRVRNYYVPFQRVENDWGRMRDVTHYERSGRRINARPFQPAEVERFVGRPVERRRVVDVQRAVPEQLRNRAARRDDDRDRRNAERTRDRAERERAAERTGVERDRAEDARRDRADDARRDRTERERVDRERDQQTRDRAERAREDRRQSDERQERAQRDQMERQRREAAEQARDQRQQQERAKRQESARQNDERGRRQAEERQERAQRDQMQQQRRQDAEQARDQRREQNEARERAQQQDRGSDRVDEQRAKRQQREERRTGSRD